MPGATTTDITSKVFLLKSPVFADPGDGANVFVQADLLINNSGATITGPVALVLTGLPSDVTLINADGSSNTFGMYQGSPYIDIAPSGGWQTGWRHFLLPVLHFYNPNHDDHLYRPHCGRHLIVAEGQPAVSRRPKYDMLR